MKKHNDRKMKLSCRPVPKYRPLKTDKLKPHGWYRRHSRRTTFKLADTNRETCSQIMSLVECFRRLYNNAGPLNCDALHPRRVDRPISKAFMELIYKQYWKS